MCLSQKTKNNQNGEGCSNTQSTSLAHAYAIENNNLLGTVTIHSLVVSLITTPKSLLKNVLGGCVESSEILILNIPLSIPSLPTLSTARVIVTLVGVAPTTIGIVEIRILPPKSLVSEIHDIVSVESQLKQVHSEVQ